MKVAAFALLAGAAFAAPTEQVQSNQAVYQAPPPGYYGYGYGPGPYYGPPSLIGGLANAAGNVVGGLANGVGNVLGGLADGVGYVADGFGGALGDVLGIGKDLTDSILGALPWTIRTEAQLAEIRAAIAPINAKYAQLAQQQ